MQRISLLLLVSLLAACGGSPEASFMNARSSDLADPVLPSGQPADTHRAADSCAFLRTAGTTQGSTRRAVFNADHCPGKSDAFYPWLTDRALSEKLLSQAQNQAGIIVVSYGKCRLRHLPDCGLPGAYRFSAGARTESTEFILSKQELARKLPFAATDLTDYFNGAGTLSIKATRVGTYATKTTSVGLRQLAAHCRSATHFVKTLDMGAFRLRVKTETKDETATEVLATGGVPERCLLSTTDATSAACQSVLKLQLIPILAGGPMPDSDPHHLLGQLPGTERGRRLEAAHMGKTFVLPVPGKVTAIVFWNPEHETGLATLGTLEEIWQRTDRQKAQLVAVATNTTILGARQKAGSLPLTFPLLIDDRDRLSRRYQVDRMVPSAMIVDEKGVVRFYASSHTGYLRRVEAALVALTDK